ncbi:MAG TPA: carbohydrate kinase family protein [Polyangiaceae bacterium]
MSGAPPPTARRRGILAAGNFIIDQVKFLDAYPEEETCVTIRSLSRSNGGAPYNVLVDLARMRVDYPLEALGLLGDDSEGLEIRNHCESLGIDTRKLASARGARTSFSDIVTITGTGKRTILQFPGASALLRKEHFDFGDTSAKILHLAFLALLEGLDQPSATHGTVAAEVLAEAQRIGLITSSDVVTDQSGRLPGLVTAALPHLDYFFANEIEMELLTGLSVRSQSGSLDFERMEAACRRLVERGLNRWLVVHTAEMAVAFRPGEPVRLQGSVRIPAVSIRGTNGAGDAFAAGFLHGVHQEEPISECLRLGVCVAAASLSDGTPSAGVTPVEQCLSLGERYGFR